MKKLLLLILPFIVLTGCTRSIPLKEIVAKEEACLAEGKSFLLEYSSCNVIGGCITDVVCISKELTD